MAGFDLLDSQTFDQLEMDHIRMEVNRRLMYHPFMHGAQTRENIIETTFVLTINVVHESLIRKGFEITKKGGEKDG